MLCMQLSIGAVNDVADVELDRVAKPGKPIPAGLLSMRIARGWAVVTAGLALALAAPSGLGAVVVAMAAIGLGYLYDLRLSRTALSWLPLSLALPLVPIFGWLGVTGSVPAALLAIVPAAVLAGAALILGNGLVDLERDKLAGKGTLPVRLGRNSAWATHAVLFGAAVAVAYVSAPGPAALDATDAPPGILGIIRALGLPLGALLVAAGAALVAAAGPGTRERGWELEGVGTLLLGVGWLAGVAVASSGGAVG
jgi:4-hydroxybenzoate polyprenyltransferase